MRYSIVTLAPFVAAAYAHETSIAGPVVVPVDVGGSTSLSTYAYSNTMTWFLTQTNSLGVVTGMPTLDNAAVATAAETSQPALVTIPAGLPTGINTVYIGGGNQSVSSFLVSVGSSTTQVVGASGAAVTTGAGASTARPSGSGSSGSSDEDTTGTSGSDASATESGASATSSSAANAHVLASGTLLGLGALFAALL